LRILFVTTEMDDFIRVGGLAAVSAALPRALRSLTDIRIMLPGYRDVVEQFAHIHVLGHLPPIAEMPGCTLGVGATKDGLPVIELRGCRSISCSARSSMTGRATHMATRAAGTGATTTSALAGSHPLPQSLRQADWTRIGQPTSFTPTTGKRR
jgi:hypothetical protein